MDPITIVLGVVAVAFALLAFMQRMRVGDLEEKVRELEAKLADRLPPPPEGPEPEPPKAEAPPAPEPEDDEEEPDDEDEDDEEPAPAAEAPAEDEDEEEDDEDGEDAPEEEDEVEALEELPADEPAPPVAEAEPPPRAEPAEPDPLRLAALEQVQKAFETCRYLDFDAIVEKPSTYRVTVPLTAATGPALRYLKDGMFPCLKQARIEGLNAVLHIDTSKGPP